MKYIVKIIFFLLLYLNVNAQLDFNNNHKYKFVFTDYLSVPELGLDTVLINEEFDFRIWIVKPDSPIKNLLRFYKNQNDPIIHADFKKLESQKTGDKVTGFGCEEFIIPDFLLDSLDLKLIFEIANSLKEIDTSFCYSVNSKKIKKYLEQNDLVDYKINDLNLTLQNFNLSLLPSEMFFSCNEKDLNVNIKPANGLNYYFEFLRPNMKNGYFYPSPSEFPSFMVEKHVDLYNVNLLINEIDKFFKILKIEIE